MPVQEEMVCNIFPRVSELESIGVFVFTLSFMTPIAVPVQVCDGMLEQKKNQTPNLAARLYLFSFFLLFCVCSVVKPQTKSISL